MLYYKHGLRKKTILYIVADRHVSTTSIASFRLSVYAFSTNLKEVLQ